MQQADQASPLADSATAGGASAAGCSTASSGVDFASVVAAIAGTGSAAGSASGSGASMDGSGASGPPKRSMSVAGVGAARGAAAGAGAAVGTVGGSTTGAVAGLGSGARAGAGSVPEAGAVTGAGLGASSAPVPPMHRLLSSTRSPAPSSSPSSTSVKLGPAARDPRLAGGACSDPGATADAAAAAIDSMVLETSELTALPADAGAGAGGAPPTACSADAKLSSYFVSVPCSASCVDNADAS
mmetsp:Transcript_23478/g.69762  ORF Transcript_23478/g.69762 Transcript_23478/m.69762 type:complete len:242 (-) Transcript_23478:1111-1836(-)